MDTQKVIAEATVLCGIMGVSGIAIIGSPWTLREAFDAALWIGGFVFACSWMGCAFAVWRENRRRTRS